jgi:3-oxoacyl-[acyl-carrier protein] reductase
MRRRDVGDGLLEGRTAIVTGAAAGIGEAIARAFAAQGARVVALDRDAAGAGRLADSLGARGTAVECDITSEDSVEDAVGAIWRDIGRADILVNNAGVNSDAFAHKMSLDAFRRVIDVNLTGTWLMTRAVLSRLRTTDEGGSIISMSSIAGKIGNAGQTNYSAAKAGLVGMTKAFAKEAARFNVRVNAIQPGLIRTSMTESMPSEAWDSKLAEIPLGRAGEPDEVAKVAVFLASDLASYVTGVVVEVAGGRAI